MKRGQLGCSRLDYFCDCVVNWVFFLSWVALLAGGDVAVLLLFSAIGRFSHGFAVFDPDTLRTADPFIAGRGIVMFFFCFEVFM